MSKTKKQASNKTYPANFCQVCGAAILRPNRLWENQAICSCCRTAYKLGYNRGYNRAKWRHKLAKQDKDATVP